MDAYYEDDTGFYFFECKCHEQFDSHPINLRTSYFSQGLIVDSLKEEDFLEKDKPIDDRLYNVIKPSAFGINKGNPRFDIKQFLTHIMGIQNKIKDSDKPATLIYYYFIPKNVKKNKAIESIIDELESEIKTIFNAPFFEQCRQRIKFKLYVQYSERVETANGSNVKIIIE